MDNPPVLLLFAPIVLTICMRGLIVQLLLGLLRITYCFLVLPFNLFFRSLTATQDRSQNHKCECYFYFHT